MLFGAFGIQKFLLGAGFLVGALELPEDEADASGHGLGNIPEKFRAEFGVVFKKGEQAAAFKGEDGGAFWSRDKVGGTEALVEHGEFTGHFARFEAGNPAGLFGRFSRVFRV